MKKLGKREKMLAAGVGVLVLLFMMEELIFSPFAEKMDVTKVRISAQEEKLKRFLYLDAQKGKIKKSFKKLRSYIEIGKTEEKALPAVMDRIEELASKCDITLLRMKPDMSEGGGRSRVYKLKKVELVTEGSGNNIVKFLYKIENSGIPLRITRLDFKVKDRDSNLMSASMEVNFIYFT